MLIRYTVATVTGVHVKCNAISFRIGAYTCIRKQSAWHYVGMLFALGCSVFCFILFLSFGFCRCLSSHELQHSHTCGELNEKKNKRILYIKIDLSVVNVNGWTEWGNHITLLNGDNFLNFYCIRTQIKWHWMQWHWLQTYGLEIIGQTYKHPRFVDCHIMWRLQNVWCIFEQSRKCVAFFFFCF